MEHIISSEKGINSIWLINDNEPNIITQSRVVVTDDKVHADLIKELRDIRNYIYVHTIESGYAKEHIMYTFDGAEKHEKGPCFNNQNIPTHTTSYYKNPRAEAFRLITGNLYSDSEDLLDLFTTQEPFGYKDKECLREFKAATKLLQVLETNPLDEKTLKRLLKRMWPNFGYYAIEGLRCTDIETIQEFAIRELQSQISSSEEARTILTKKELAQRNGKVLSLARRAHKMIYPSK